MLWWQALGLITIVYSSKSSGKFLGSSNLCDIDFTEGHPREISRGVTFDMIWLMYLRFKPEQVLFFVLEWFSRYLNCLNTCFRGRKIGSIGKNMMYRDKLDLRNECSIRGLSWKLLTMLAHNCMHRMVYGRWKERNITIWDLKRNIQSVPHCYMGWLLRSAILTGKYSDLFISNGSTSIDHTDYERYVQ